MKTILLISILLLSGCAGGGNPGMGAAFQDIGRSFSNDDTPTYQPQIISQPKHDVYTYDQSGSQTGRISNGRTYDNNGNDTGYVD
jgi:hypothetical protein